jgi:hypothetical protein
MTREELQRAWERIPPRSKLDALLRRLDDQIHVAAILYTHGERYGCGSSVLKAEIDELVERRAKLFLASVEAK